jgi:hypothetical protein
MVERTGRSGRIPSAIAAAKLMNHPATEGSE